MLYIKKNGGLSDARNIAVAQSKGEYIVFIDSDDYVDSNHLSSLWDAMVKNDADMSCSPPIIEYETVDTAENDGLFEHCSKNNVSSFELCVSAREAQAIILRGYPVGTSAWSKIIKKEYCVKHPFPKGKVMEELATVYHIMEETNKVVFIGVKTYHYVQRVGSILHSEFSLEEVDEYMSMAEKYAINAPNIDIKYAAATRLILLSLRLVCAPNGNDEKKIYSVVVKYCRKYLKYYIMDNKMNFREKIRALLMVVSPVTIRLYVWRKKKTSMLYM